MTDSAGNMARNAWYCVHCKPKQEHKAALSLNFELKLVTFCPRMRYRKPTSRGPVWFVDAVFPGYIFVKSDISTNLTAVRHTTGVAEIVSFGENIPSLPDSMIETMKKSMHGREMIVFTNPAQAGDEAMVLDGPFRGLEVVVSRILPAKQRVNILMNVLGRAIEAETVLSNLAVRKLNPMAA